MAVLPFDGHPDPPMSDDFKKNLKNIEEWDYYGHGKIRVTNANIYINWKIPGKRTPDSRQLFWHGDLTQQRIEFLQKLTQKFECNIEIWPESRRGVDRIKMWRHYKNGRDILTIGEDGLPREGRR